MSYVTLYIFLLFNISVAKYNFITFKVWSSFCMVNYFRFPLFSYILITLDRQILKQKHQLDLLKIYQKSQSSNISQMCFYYAKMVSTKMIQLGQKIIYCTFKAIYEKKRVYDK